VKETDASGEEMKAAAPPTGVPGRQVACRHDNAGSGHLRYLLFLPARYEKETAGWPLMVFLHGAGERGDDLNLVKKYGPPMIVEDAPDFPFVVVSPQCLADRHWDPQQVIALVEDVVASHRIDRQRIVLTGVSLGGFGTWMTAAAYPRRFAALAPVCGWGAPALAVRLRDVPVWIFHGEDDDVVPIGRSREMRDALLDSGGDVRFTSFPGVGHDAWTEAYATPALYAWLLQCRASGNPSPN
jgi:predicted peptidase